MGQTDPGQARKRRLPGFPGKKAGEIGGGEIQARRKLLHGKAFGKMLLHIMKRRRHSGGGLGKGRGFQRPQQGGQKPVDKLAAFVTFQLPSFPDFPVQVQPQQDGEAVPGQKEAGTEGFPDPVKKGEGGFPAEMDIQKFPAYLWPVRRQKVTAFLRDMDEEGFPGGQGLRLPRLFKDTLPAKRILKEIAAVIPFRVVIIIGFLLPRFQAEVKKDKGLVRQRTGLQETKASKSFVGQKITLLCHFFILDASFYAYYNQDRQGGQDQKTLRKNAVKMIPCRKGTECQETEEGHEQKYLCADAAHGLEQL